MCWWLWQYYEKKNAKKGKKKNIPRVNWALCLSLHCAAKQMQILKKYRSHCKMHLQITLYKMHLATKQISMKSQSIRCSFLWKLAMFIYSPVYAATGATSQIPFRTAEDAIAGRVDVSSEALWKMASLFLDKAYFSAVQYLTLFLFIFNYFFFNSLFYFCFDLVRKAISLTASWSITAHTNGMFTLYFGMCEPVVHAQPKRVLLSSQTGLPVTDACVVLFALFQALQVHSSY